MALKDVASKPKPKGKKSQDPKIFMFAVPIDRKYQGVESEIAIAMDGTDTEYNRANFIMGAYDTLHAEVCKPKPKPRAKTTSKKAKSKR
jgi:hypothetical protein